MNVINLGKHDRREPHVLVAVIGRLKRDYGNIMHLLPLVNVTLLRISIRM